jgi:hypothetical protein
MGIPIIPKPMKPIVSLDIFTSSVCAFFVITTIFTS